MGGVTMDGKIEVPEGMLKAAISHMENMGFSPAKESTKELIGAALRWLAENEEIKDLLYEKKRCDLWADETNYRIQESFRRGQRSK